MVHRCFIWHDDVDSFGDPLLSVRTNCLPMWPMGPWVGSSQRWIEVPRAWQCLSPFRTWKYMKWIEMGLSENLVSNLMVANHFPYEKHVDHLGGIPACSDTPKSWSLLRFVAEVVTRSSLALQCQRRDALRDGSRLRKQRIPLKNHMELKGLSENRVLEYWLTVTVPILSDGNFRGHFSFSDKPSTFRGTGMMPISERIHQLPQVFDHQPLDKW